MDFSILHGLAQTHIHMHVCTALTYMSYMSYPVPVTGLILRHIEIFLFLISVEIKVSECITGARWDFYLVCWDTSDCSDILLF